VFMDDLRSRLANRVQLTTDGHKPYLTAVYDAFGQDVDMRRLSRFTAKRRAMRSDTVHLNASARKLT